MSTQIEINQMIIEYLSKISHKPNLIINEIVKETQKLGGVARMQIALEQAQFMEIIVKLIKAKNCLEIGRFTGLSSLCLAKGLPKDGKLITIDNSNEFENFAKKFWKKAAVEEKIISIIGDGSKTLNDLIDQKKCFDLVFIDADKNNYDIYYELSLKLISSNGLILIDNMLWGGDVANLSIKDKSTESIRQLNKKIFTDSRVECTLLPIADGLLFIRKK